MNEKTLDKIFDLIDIEPTVELRKGTLEETIFYRNTNELVFKINFPKPLIVKINNSFCFKWFRKINLKN